MNEHMIHVLLVEDNPGDARLVQEMVGHRPGVSIHHVDYLAAGIEFLAARRVDLVLLDLGLSDSHGLDTLREVITTAPAVPVVVFTGNDDQAVGRSAIREGAQDYLVKSTVDEQTLTRTIRYAIERKRAEEALRESERRFRGLYENVPIGLYRTTPHGRIQLANPALLEMLGYKSLDQLAGRNLMEGDYEPEYPRQAFLERIEREGEVRGVEGGWRRKDGSTIFVSESARAVRNEKGETIYYDGFVADITERKRGEERIDNLNRILRAIRDINQMIVQEKNPEMLIRRTGEILVSHRAYRAVLVILTDGTGKPLTYAEEGAKELFQSVIELVKNGTAPPCCEAARRREGVFFVTDHAKLCAPCPEASNCDPGGTMCIRLQQGDTLYGYLAGSVADVVRNDPDEQSLLAEMAGDVAFALHNIEQGKAMQEMQDERDHFAAELRQAQKMEAIGALAGGIAHDFNNILTAIMGFSQLVEQDLDKSSLTYKNLQEVTKASRRARELVKQILTFSRQSGQELQPVEVKLIVKETLKLLSASLPATIEIVQHIQSGATVWSDATEIHRIMMNLCSNSSYAMGEKGGILEVNLEDIELDADSLPRHPDMKPGKYVLLEVKDTGQGISPSVMDRIFEPFFTTKGRGEGTGMGLAVVHGIVKKIGGFVTVYSEVGQGADFKVYMPSISHEGKAASKKEVPIPKGKERILLVDDEPALVDMGKQLLERLGYEVTSRTSSIEALQLFRARPDDFDLAITDLTMPKLTGDELALEILKIRKDFPVILCTGFSNILNEERAKQIGIRAFVMKPIVIADLGRIVRQVLDMKA